jgi:hypothetical protein
VDERKRLLMLMRSVVVGAAAGGRFKWWCIANEWE